MKKLLVLCVSALAAAVILASPATVEYHIDYEYVEGTSNMYKVHKEAISPDQIALTCTKEGAMPVSSEEIDLSQQLQALFKKYPKLDSVCIWDKGSALKVSRGEDKLTTDSCESLVCKLTELRTICKEGYSYSPIVGSCYKIPHVTLDWNGAYEYCEKEGTHLAVVNSEAEHQELKAKMQRDGWTSGSTNPSYYLIGFKADNNRVFKTIFNETLEEAGYSKWSDTEPNNLSGNENCGSLFADDGKLNDIICSTQAFAFICEQVIQYVDQADVNKLTQDDKTAPSNEKPIEHPYDFAYIDGTGSLYKVHNRSLMRNWIPQACKNEEAVPLTSSDNDIYEQLQLLFSKYPKLDAVCILDAENAIQVNREGERLLSEECTSAVCKKPTGCSPGYTYSPSTGSCYKIPMARLKWEDAHSYCQNEGTHLAIVNSKSESRTLKTMMDRHGLIYDSKDVFYFIGFRANDERIFKTIMNETLEQAGFSVWTHGPPSANDDNDNCGCIYTFNGHLNYLSCSTELSSFICEEELNHTSLAQPNAVVFPVASSDDMTVDYYPNGYEHVEGTEYLYKFQKKSLPRHHIVNTCKEEGAAPLSTSEGDIYQQLQALFSKYKKLNKLCIWHDKYHLAITVNREGERRASQDCVSLVCKKPTVCKPGYTYSTAVNSCYRIPKEKRMWEEAYILCEREGAHLAVINSDTERKVLKALINRYALTHNSWDMYYYIGFRANKDRVFKTVFNETLDEAGFNIWSHGEPNNDDENEYCGSLYSYNSKLNDVPCYKDSSAFICEQYLDDGHRKQPTVEVNHDNFVPKDGGKYTTTTDRTDIKVAPDTKDVQKPDNDGITESHLTPQEGHTLSPRYPFLPGHQAQAMYLLQPYTLQPGSLTSGAENGLSSPEQPNSSPPLPMYVIAFTLPDVNISCPCYFLKPNQTNASKPQPMPAQPTPYGIIGFAPVIFMPNCQESNVINNKNAELPKAVVVHYKCNDCQATGQQRQRRSASLVHEITTLEELDDLLKKHIKPAREDMGNIGANVNNW